MNNVNKTMLKIPNSSPADLLPANDFCLDLCINGLSEYSKLSFPAKYGCFSRITTQDAVLEFNLNHEIRHAQSRLKTWRHPQEWLKRSVGNDWVYYSTGGYAGVFEAIGEYYLPNLPYITNSLLGGRPFDEPAIDHLVTRWYDIICSLKTDHLPARHAEWMEKVRVNTPEKLEKKAARLFDILGTRISVMPPDARHVDYNIIPVPICDGCLYKCRFCKVKNKNRFQIYPKEKIDSSIRKIKELYARDTVNYNALFLGDHDALNAPSDLILHAARKAYHQFEFKSSFMKNRFLFLFGSVDSLLSKKESFFTSLDRLPYNSYINIGLESFDAATLERLGKPLAASAVEKAFERIQDINSRFQHIEITCNFVMDEGLSDAHYSRLFEMIRDRVSRTRPKGCVYLSPLAFGKPSRQVLYDFYKIKSLSRFPTYLYLIQRL